MRGFVLILAAALGVAACGNNDETENMAGANQLTAERIVANDVTAIDAVTGDAANMAEDVDITNEMLAELDPGDGNEAAPRRPRPDRPAIQPRPRERSPEPSTPAPEPAPATNATGNSTE